MTDAKNDEPFINIWFGNFYEPAYSDRSFVDHALDEIRELGFNNVMLDSKSWEDFSARYDGAQASPYVHMQEYMMEAMRSRSLSHNFLAIYLNGDNLYPHIRFSPPVYGESVTAADGSDGRWYKYWSPKARDLMISHVAGLLRLYRDNHSELKVDGRIRLPLCSMWDPIVAPSFDDEGIARYQSWLAAEYGRDIGRLNGAYGCEFAGFDGLAPADYWYPLKYGAATLLTKDDVDALSPAFRIWTDNMKWRLFELADYFAAMKTRFAALDSGLWLSPNISQWNIFLNINGSRLPGVSFGDLWDTANRGIDPFVLCDTVDNCTFTVVPVSPQGDADAYVAACQAAMIRSMNRGRDFTVGIFFGRFLYNDIYRYVSPAETVASVVASGASGYFVYGYGGMDDGGIMHRMDPAFKESIRAGNAWAKEVIPLLGAKKSDGIAILYPSAMALLEPLGVEGNEERRLDFLGSYRAACGSGFHPDILSIEQIAEGGLEGYSTLVIPADDCYAARPVPEAERRLDEWVRSGGSLIHGPRDRLVKNAFGIEGRRMEKDCMLYHEKALVQGSDFESFSEGEAVATWIGSGGICVARHDRGDGRIYSFGFRYGYSYIARIAPHVPQEQGNRELYPVPYLTRDPFRDILTAGFADRAGDIGPNAGRSPCRGVKDIEFAAFENGLVIVNHSSYPYRLDDPARVDAATTTVAAEGGAAGTNPDMGALRSGAGQRHFQIPAGNDILMSHSAVFIQSRQGPI